MAQEKACDYVLTIINTHKKVQEKSSSPQGKMPKNHWIMLWLILKSIQQKQSHERRSYIQGFQ